MAEKMPRPDARGAGNLAAVFSQGCHHRCYQHRFLGLCSRLHPSCRLGTWIQKELKNLIIPEKTLPLGLFRPDRIDRTLLPTIDPTSLEVVESSFLIWDNKRMNPHASCRAFDGSHLNSSGAKKP